MKDLKVTHKRNIIKSFSSFNVMISFVLISAIVYAGFSSESDDNIAIFYELSLIRYRRGKKVYRYYVSQKRWIKPLLTVLCRVLLAYFLLHGVSLPDTFDASQMANSAIVIGILCLSIIQYGALCMALRLESSLYSKYAQNLSLWSQSIISVLWHVCLLKLLCENKLLLCEKDIMLPIFWVLTTNNAVRITLQTEHVKVEDFGDFFRITVRGVIWADVKKDQLFEIRALCVQLHRTRIEDGKPLLMLKEIAQAFDLPSLKTVGGWGARVAEQGTLLALDFEKKQTQIINELKYNTEVLTPEVLKRVQELCQENPFFTYLEIREILFHEGIATKMGEVSIRNALERIPFYVVRDSIKKQLQNGQMSYQQSYLTELLQGLLKCLEKGETIPKAQLINVYNIVTSCQKQTVIPVCLPTKAKIEQLSQILFKADSSTGSDSQQDARTNDMPSQSIPGNDVQIGRLMLNLRLYVSLRGSYRRVANLMGIATSTSYEWVKLFGQISCNLLAFIGVIRFSGTLCIDDKWIKIAQIKQESQGKRKFGYAFFAIDPVTLDLLHVEVFDKNGADAFKLFLLSLRAQGIRPYRIITDLAGGYSDVIAEVFGEKVLHHHCLFHFKQSIYKHLDKAFGLNTDIAHKPRRLHLKKQLEALIFNVVDASARKTCYKHYQNLEPIKKAYLSIWPKSKPVFDCLDRHFDKILNARENHKVVLTNNTAELVIRNFTQHYKTMAGFETIQSARNYLLIFQLVYRFSKLDDEIQDINRRGKSPLSLAGYQDIESMPFYRYLNQPLLQNFIPSISCK